MFNFGKTSRVVINDVDVTNSGSTDVSSKNVINVYLGTSDNPGELVNVVENKGKVTVTVNGSCEAVDVNMGDVMVNGNTGSVNASMGNVTVRGDVSGGATTKQGDISCSNVSGDVMTDMGDITAAQIFGKAKTLMGDIKIR